MEAGALLRAGALVAFPTETVYGLGADATNPDAVDALYRVKGRPPDNPVIVHVGHNADILSIGVVEDARVMALFKRFWPGALTLVIPAQEPYRSTVGRGLQTVAVRMPGHPIALALIHAAGIPIAAPSANRSGRPSPTTAQHVLSDLAGLIPLILDGGPCAVGIESTVVDLSTTETRILRPGLISGQEISEVLGMPVVEARTEGSERSPGTRHAHYQPSVPVRLIPQGSSDRVWEDTIAAVQPLERLGIIARNHRALSFPDTQTIWRLARHPEALTVHFFSFLRELEALGVDAILIEGIDEREPVMDRIRRAAS